MQCILISVTKNKKINTVLTSTIKYEKYFRQNIRGDQKNWRVRKLIVTIGI